MVYIIIVVYVYHIVYNTHDYKIEYMVYLYTPHMYIYGL